MIRMYGIVDVRRTHGIVWESYNGIVDVRRESVRTGGATSVTRPSVSPLSLSSLSLHQVLNQEVPRPPPITHLLASPIWQ